MESPYFNKNSHVNEQSDPRENIVINLWKTFAGELKSIVDDWRNNGSIAMQNLSIPEEIQQKVSEIEGYIYKLYFVFYPQEGGTITENVWNTIDSSMKKDPSAILNAYKMGIINAYTKFINLVAQQTGIKKENEIVRYIYQIYNKYPQNNTNPFNGYNKIFVFTNELKKIEDLPSTQPTLTSTSAVTTPSSGTSIVSPTVAPVSKPTVTPSVTPTPSGGTPSSGGSNTPYGSDSSSPQMAMKKDYPYIINRAIDIIINTIKTDVSRSTVFFTSPLPKKGNFKPLTVKEDVGNNPRNASSNTPPEEEQEREGEFLYNFHSKFNKQRNFIIRVKPGMSNLNGPIELKNLTALKRQKQGGTARPVTVTVGVFWEVIKSHENKIRITVSDNEGDTSHYIMMLFYDHDIAPEMGSNTRGDANEFSIENVLLKANPSYGDPLKYADPQIKNKIDSKRELLLRSFYAAISRKHMEFKSKKGQKIEELTFDDNGDVTVYKKDNNGNIKSIQFTQSQVMQKVHSTDLPTQKLWRNTLDYYNYFDKFPQLRPEVPEEFESFQTAVQSLITQGYAEHDSNILVKRAWELLRSGESKKQASDITSIDLLKTIKSGATNTEPQQQQQQQQQQPNKPGSKPQVEKPNVDRKVVWEKQTNNILFYSEGPTKSYNPKRVLYMIQNHPDSKFIQTFMKSDIYKDYMKMLKLAIKKQKEQQKENLEEIRIDPYCIENFY